MKFVIQCVSEASCTVGGRVTGAIERGYLILVGISDSDTEETAERMLKKTAGLRVFPDENGKTNLSLADIEGSVLLISQFTLYADCRKGNRPSFVKAGKPEHAERLYRYLVIGLSPNGKATDSDSVILKVRILLAQRAKPSRTARFFCICYFDRYAAMIDTVYCFKALKFRF